MQVKYGIIPPRNYYAITWFGTIYINKQNKSEWEQDPNRELTISHENIHLRQAQIEGSWCKFYIKYLWKWIKAFIMSGCKNSIAYYCNPYEIEAYIYEADPTYNMQRSKVFQKLSIKKLVKYKKNIKGLKDYLEAISQMY